MNPEANNEDENWDGVEVDNNRVGIYFDGDDDPNVERDVYDRQEDCNFRRMVSNMYWDKFEDLDRYFKQKHLDYIADREITYLLNSLPIAGEEVYYELAPIITERAIRAYNVHWKLHDNLLLGKRFWNVFICQIIQYPEDSIMNCLKEKAILDCEEYRRTEETNRQIQLYLCDDDDDQVDPRLYLQDFFANMRDFGINPRFI